MGRRWQNNRNDAGSLLASTFVVALGSGVTVFMLVGLAPRENWKLAATIGGSGFVLMLFIFWMRFSRTPGGSLGFWSIFGRSHREDHMAGDYLPRKVADGKSSMPASDHRPITAEEVREIQVTSPNTWVPTKTRHGGRS